eukprot:8363491-Lingulodinium_polyedra.AAC.1
MVVPATSCSRAASRWPPSRSAAGGPATPRSAGTRRAAGSPSSSSGWPRRCSGARAPRLRALARPSWEPCAVRGQIREA